MSLSGRYRIRSDIKTRTVRLDREGDTELMAQCGVCLWEKPVHEVTADGSPVCSLCWPSHDECRDETCQACGCVISDDRAKASAFCPSCQQDEDDADMACQERSAR